MKTLVRKLQISVNNPDLPVLPDKTNTGSVVNVAGSAGFIDIVTADDLTNVASISFKVEADSGIWNHYAMINFQGHELIQGDAQRGYYVYNVGEKYTYTASALLSPFSGTYRAFVDAANSLGNGTVNMVLEIVYND